MLAAHEDAGEAWLACTMHCLKTKVPYVSCIYCWCRYTSLTLHELYRLQPRLVSNEIAQTQGQVVPIEWE